jgi:hypothetical protein
MTTKEISKQLTKAEIEEWQEAKEKLDYYKEFEMELRKAIVEKALGSDVYDTLRGESTTVDGLTNFKIEAKQGVSSKLSFGEYYAFGMDNMSFLESEIVFDKPTLDNSALKKLKESEPDSKVLLMFESTPSAPTLSVKWL